MQIHELKTKTNRKSKKVVGRGGKRGKTSGRGTKGQKARAGHRIRPAMRDIIKKIPKKRGEGVSRNQFKTEAENTAIVNVGTLSAVFVSGEKVTPKVLLERGLIEKKGDKMPEVKILAHGELDKKIDVRGCAFSETAKAAIEKLGGSIA